MGADGTIPALVVYHQDGLQVVRLDEGRGVVIGREAPSDLRLRCGKLSRRHADFRAVGRQIWVEDLGSTNGTFLNGERIRAPAPVALGDEVRLGSVTVSLAKPVDLPGTDRPAVSADDPVPARHGAAMLALHHTVSRVAASAISVLIVGETGSGKEVIARAIHGGSGRCDAAMRVINCGAIPETLVESILFGHERGAFTGADQRRIGVFEEARGGTVLLDEIGELSLQAQVALLRVLENHRVQRVGSSNEVDVDVRVLAATHRDLETMCESGSFRWDLLYRLNPITLRVPPLRERRGEIPALVAQFIREANQANDRAVRGIAADALALLRDWRWPGNVRELRNTIERAVVISPIDVITPQDLPERIQVRSIPSEPRITDQDPTPAIRFRTTVDTLHSLDLKDRSRQHEIELIRAALHAARENQTAASRVLGIPRRTLVYKLRTLGIEGGEATEAVVDRVDDQGRPIPFAARIAEFERSLIDEAMVRAGGDRAAAARLLNVQRRTLDTKLGSN